MSIGILVGNPKQKSRTYHAAEAVARALTGRDPDFRLDLAEFGAALLDWSDPGVAAAVEQVTSARLVVVASPTFKATYTGLLKVFLDRFAAGSLAGVVAIPLQLGGSWRHALAPEVFLKPVLAEIVRPPRPARCTCSTPTPVTIRPPALPRRRPCVSGCPSPEPNSQH